MNNNNIELGPRIGRTIEEVYQERHLRNKDVIVTDEKQSYLFNDPSIERTNYLKLAIKNTHEKTVLNTLFFSKENMKSIQNQIIYYVYKKMGKRIDYQNNDDLFIIMKRIYLGYSKHLNTDIKNQIKELNDLVIGDALPIIINGIDSHLKYVSFLNGDRQLNERPIFTGSSGTKSARLSTGLGF